jgi:hypothetical protein
MHWNIRVVKYSEGEETFLEVAEVYYNELGKPCGFHVARPSGESVDELYQYTDWMSEALTYPILEFDKDFGEWDK